MKPSRIDFAVDLAYGVLLFLAIVLIVTVGTNVGISFGLGALVSYIIHVVWKMARFDPEWMTEEISESIGETLTEEVSESVEKQVAAEVTENVEETFSEEVDEIATKIDAVNERIEEQRSTEDGESPVDEATEESDAETEDER